MSEQVYCVLDYETYSESNLKDVGAYEYSMHPSTEIICAAWRIGTREQLRTAKTESSNFKDPYSIARLMNVLVDPGHKLIAHNAFFEQVITRNVLTRHIEGRSEIKPRLANILPERWL